MAAAEFRIDLSEVETAARLIRGMVDDLEAPTNHLEAVVKQIRPSVYGTDLLGKALQGGGSSVGGLADHQEQVLTGIRAFLKNSAAMAQNLRVMCDNHRATDDLHASDLTRVLDGAGAPAAPPALPAPGAAPGPAPAPVTAPGSGYQGAAAPELTYNTPRPHDPAPHGGGRNLLI
ncbi:hypothetical protein [Kitasatospora sp. NPDC094015]|uniref:hypothetical protein n=1 Tax=Kitasatospora sp. NPDC094015 TaxID=3155205 RepID=UPI0033332A8D